MVKVVGAFNDVAPGDIRALGPGDTVIVWRSATTREDWAKCWDAIGVAVARGSDLRID